MRAAILAWDDIAGPPPNLAYERSFSASNIARLHPVDSGQLVVAIAGCATVTVGEASYVLPPHRAIWVPAGYNYHLNLGRSAITQNIPVERSGDPAALNCRVFDTTPLVRALIGEIAAAIRTNEARRAAFVALLLTEIGTIADVPSSIMLPRDRRLRRVCDAIVANPDDIRPIDEWAAEVCLSRRAFTRLFGEQLGIGFAAWRRQVRMVHAVSRIAAGESITSVAYEVGYDSPSAFSALFRRTFGECPRLYCRKIEQVVQI